MTATPPNPANQERDRPDEFQSAPRWVKIFGGVLALLLLVFIAMHLAGGGFRNHGP